MDRPIPLYLERLMELEPDMHENSSERQSMHVHTAELTIKTRGHGELHDITDMVGREVKKSGISEGMATIFVSGATAGVTTIEFEDGLIQDFEDLWEEIVPRDRQYHHNARWGDGNGHSHVRASMLGPSLSVPVALGKLTLGTWQQIVLADFDNRPRTRVFICQIMGLRKG
jgi:secondary thiamine-phosphate synthase enzyme